MQFSTGTMRLPWPTWQAWPVWTSLYFNLSSITHGIMVHYSPCGMPHGPHCLRPRSIISLNQGYKKTGGPNATWEALHPPRLHNLCHLHSCIVRSVHSLPWTSHLVALRLWHAHCGIDIDIDKFLIMERWSLVWEFGAELVQFLF
jgi:hypothetical protein